MKYATLVAWITTAIALCIWGVVMVVDLEHRTAQLNLAVAELDHTIVTIEAEMVERRQSILEATVELNGCKNVENQ